MSAMDDMLSWLASVLDAMERHEHERYSDDDGYLYEPSEAVLARVAAERTILTRHGDLAAEWARTRHLGPHPDGMLPADYMEMQAIETVLATLAHGHRFDAPGFDPSWAPEGATTRA